MLRDSQISDILSVTISNPLLLNPKQRRLFCRALGIITDESVTLPIAFAEPFSKCWAAKHDRINSLHSYGQTVIKCLAACLIAERDGTVGRHFHDGITTLFEREIYLPFEDTTEEISVLQTFANELFEMVSRYKIIDGFVAPDEPCDNNRVPNINLEQSFGARFEPYTRQFDLAFTKGVCGKVITQWPLKK